MSDTMLLGIGNQAMSEEYTHEPLEVAEGILSGKYALTSVYVLVNQIEDLTHERNDARAEVERLQSALDAGEDPLVKSDSRI